MASSSTTKSEPRVREIAGEFWRFHVKSATRPGVEWLVDLEEHRVGDLLNGACSCEKFSFDCGPALAHGAVPSKKTECRHIREAWDYWRRHVAPKVADALKEQAR